MAATPDPAIGVVQALGYASALEEARRITDTDHVSYHNINFEGVSETLAILIPEAHHLSYTARHDIARRALFRLTSPDPLTPEFIWQMVTHELHTYLRRPQSLFHVYTTLAIKRSFMRRSARLEHIGVRVLPHVPQRVARAFSQLDHGANHWGEDVQAQQPIRLAVEARSAADAVELASTDFDFLRGLWNWRINRQIIYRTTSGRQPFNTIRIGPRYSVHRPSGELVTTQYWYEPSYVETPNLPWVTPHQWQTSLREEVRVRRLMRRIPYSEDLKDAFKTYARALDTSDHEVSLLKLWGILEALVGARDGSHRLVVRRCANLFENIGAAEAELDLIRDQRNRVAHSRRTAGSEEHIAMVLRRYVDLLFKMHLGLGHKFDSLSDFGEFLSLSRDQATLRTQLSRVKLAIRFHTRH